MVEAAGGRARSTSGSRPTGSRTSVTRLCAGLVEGADAIIVAGGVSVGPYDVVEAAFEAVGEIELWRVAVQPGKPFAFGTAGHRRPGGRSAAALAVRAAGQPGLELRDLRAVRPPGDPRAWPGRDATSSGRVDRAVLGETVPKSRGRRAFLRVTAERDAHGTPRRDDRGRVRVQPRGRAGRAGEPRAVGAGDGRRPRRHPRGGRPPPGRRRGRAVVARPGLTVRRPGGGTPLSSGT